MCTCTFLNCSCVLEHLCDFMWLESFVCTAIFSTLVTKHILEVTPCQDKHALSEKPTGRHIRIISTKENTSLLYSTTETRGHLTHTYTHAGYLNTYSRCTHMCTACEHTPLWSHLLSGQTPVVLSNSKATKWMD